MLPCKTQELTEVFENVVDRLLRQHLGDQNTKYLLKKMVLFFRAQAAEAVLVASDALLSQEDTRHKTHRSRQV